MEFTLHKTGTPLIKMFEAVDEFETLATFHLDYVHNKAWACRFRTLVNILANNTCMKFEIMHFFRIPHFSNE